MAGHITHGGVIEVESSVAVVNPRSDQSSAGGVDDLNSLLCVQRGLNLNQSTASYRSK